jgi:hypothetical protein
MVFVDKRVDTNPNLTAQIKLSVCLIKYQAVRTYGRWKFCLSLDRGEC